MNKFMLLMALIFSALFINAQSSIVTYLVTPDYSDYFPMNAKSVKEKLYVKLGQDEGVPDTTITYLGEVCNLKVLKVSEKIDAGNGKIETIVYNKEDGTIESKGYRLFKDNLLIEDVDIQEKETLKSMGYNKYLSYENGKLTKIIDKPCKDCDNKSKVELSYDKEMFPKEIFYGNSFAGEMRLTRSKIGKNFRYDYEMIAGEEMKALFEQMGKTHDENEVMPYDEILVNEKNKTYTVVHYKADKENGVHFIEAKTEMTFDGKKLLEEEYYNGDLGTQIKYAYNDKGQQKSLTDMNGTVYPSEFNKEGQYTKKRDNYNWTIMDYDAQGNMIRSASTGYGDALNSITLFEIAY